MSNARQNQAVRAAESAVALRNASCINTCIHFLYSVLLTFNHHPLVFFPYYDLRPGLHLLSPFVSTILQLTTCSSGLPLFFCFGSSSASSSIELLRFRLIARGAFDAKLTFSQIGDFFFLFITLCGFCFGVGYTAGAGCYVTQWR